MKKAFLFSLALGSVSIAAPADYHLVRALQFEGGVYLANPVVDKQWIGVDDASAACTVFTAASDDRTGAKLVSPQGREAFVSDWSVLYTRPDAKAPWAVTANGQWIESIDQLGWTHLLFHKQGDINPEATHFVWQGAEVTFINDPRFGDNFYYQNAQHGKTWYRVDRQGHCEVLTESAREYGQPDLQTVKMSGQSGEWSVETGRANDLPGNWLAR